MEDPDFDPDQYQTGLSGAVDDCGGCMETSEATRTDDSTRRTILKRAVAAGTVPFVTAGTAAATPPGKGKQESFYRRRIAASEQELVTKIKAVERATVLKVFLKGENAGRIEYSGEQVKRPAKALRAAAEIEEDGRITIPGIEFTPLIVRSEPFVLNNGDGYRERSAESTDSRADGTQVSVTSSTDIVTQSNRFRQVKSPCRYSGFSGYTHLFKGTAFTLSEPAANYSKAALQIAICAVLVSTLKGALVCGLAAEFIKRKFANGRSFSVGFNDFDINLLVGKSPYSSLRVGQTFSPTLSNTTAISIAPGHAERQLDASVLFPTGYQPTS